MFEDLIGLKLPIMMVLGDWNLLEAKKRGTQRVWNPTEQEHANICQIRNISQKCKSKYKQDKVNNADSAFIFLIIQSQNQWSG